MPRFVIKNVKERRECFILLKRMQKNARTLRSFEKNARTLRSFEKNVCPTLIAGLVGENGTLETLTGGNRTKETFFN